MNQYSEHKFAVLNKRYGPAENGDVIISVSNEKINDSVIIQHTLLLIQHTL